MSNQKKKKRPSAGSASGAKSAPSGAARAGRGRTKQAAAGTRSAQKRTSAPRRAAGASAGGISASRRTHKAGKTGTPAAGRKKKSSLRIPFLSENTVQSLKAGYMRCSAGISAVFYAAMVFVVIFGISRQVYNGFPAFVPYLIMTLFLLMAFIRLYESLVNGKSLFRKKKKTRPERAEEDR